MPSELPIWPNQSSQTVLTDTVSWVCSYPLFIGLFVSFENGALKSTKDLFIKKKKLNQMQLFPKWLGMFMHAKADGSK